MCLLKLMCTELFLLWSMHQRRNSSNPCKIIYLFLLQFGRKTSKREFIPYQHFNCWDYLRVCSICSSTLSKVTHRMRMVKKILMKMKQNRKTFLRMLKMSKHKNQNNKKIQRKWKMIKITAMTKNNKSRQNRITSQLRFKKCASQFGALLKVNFALDLNKCPSTR